MTFEIEWVKDSGGGIEFVMGADMMQALKKFFDYWGPDTRNVIRIEAVDDNTLSKIKPQKP